MAPELVELCSRLGNSPRLKRDAKLSGLLYYHIGGPSELLLKNPTDTEIRLALKWGRDFKQSIWILGAGTNLLVADRGLPGLSLYLGPDSSSLPEVISESSSDLLIKVPAQFPKAALLQWAFERRLRGLEFSAGIPGTLGGAVFMNAGTKWGSYADCIEFVNLYSIERGDLRRSRDEMGFRYRGHGEGLLDGQTIVLSVEIRLRKAVSNEEICASQKLIDEILCYRGERQPLDYPSCGSVFKNPENSARGAGRLIEASGIKGQRQGGAFISDKHANFILNSGNAAASDVLKLIKFAQETVKKDHGISLETEVLRLGFEGEN